MRGGPAGQRVEKTLTARGGGQHVPAAEPGMPLPNASRRQFLEGLFLEIETPKALKTAQEHDGDEREAIACSLTLHVVCGKCYGQDRVLVQWLDSRVLERYGCPLALLHMPPTVVFRLHVPVDSFR